MRSGDKRQRYAFYLILPNEFMPNLAKKSKFGMNSTYKELLNSKIKASLYEYEISLNAAYSFKSLANSQTTMPAVTLTLSECFVPN